MKPLFNLLFIAGLSAGGIAARAQSTLYGVTFFDNQLISIDQTTGAGTLIGPLGTSSPFGIANRFGKLYTFSPSNSHVQEINPANGQVNSSISIGLGPVQGEGDIAFRPDGIGFLSSALDSNLNPVNDVYSFDITTGTSTRLGSSSVAIDGLAFDGNTLYALGQGDGRLFTVNQSNGSLSPVGSLGVDQNSPVAGLTVGQNGALFGAIDDRLYRIDKLTGAASPVDASVLDFGFSSVSGLAATSVPEPGTWALISVGLAALGFCRRKRS